MNYEKFLKWKLNRIQSNLRKQKSMLWVSMMSMNLDTFIQGNHLLHKLLLSLQMFHNSLYTSWNAFLPNSSLTLWGSLALWKGFLSGLQGLCSFICSTSTFGELVTPLQSYESIWVQWGGAYEKEQRADSPRVRAMTNNHIGNIRGLQLSIHKAATENTKWFIHEEDSWVLGQHSWDGARQGLAFGLAAKMLETLVSVPAFSSCLQLPAFGHSQMEQVMLQVADLLPCTYEKLWWDPSTSLQLPALVWPTHHGSRHITSWTCNWKCSLPLAHFLSLCVCVCTCNFVSQKEKKFEISTHIIWHIPHILYRNRSRRQPIIYSLR